MSLLLRAAAILVALIVSAATKMHAVIFGQPVTIPWLGIAAAIILLILAALVLWLLRQIIRDGGLRLRYAPVT